MSDETTLSCSLRSLKASKKYRAVNSCGIPTLVRIRSGGIRGHSLDCSEGEEKVLEVFDDAELVEEVFLIDNGFPIVALIIYH